MKGWILHIEIKKPLVIFVQVLLACILTPATPAALPQAEPSFGCRGSLSHSEQQVCQNVLVSRLDKELASSYKDALEKLSPDGRKSLHLSQIAWLKFIKTICDIDNGASTEDRPAERCLSQQYKERMKLLQSTTGLSGMAIFPVSRFNVRRSAGADTSGSHDGFVTTEVSYPKLEGGSRALRSAFNRVYERYAREAVELNPEKSTATDYSVGYQLLKATDQLLTIRAWRYFYAHGTPHGIGDATVYHWLVKEGRPLHTQDIFDSSRSWAQIMYVTCYDNLVEKLGQIWDSPDLDSFIKKLGAVTTNPQRWSFDSDGLTIHFMPYEVGAYAAGMPDVLVPWEYLKDYMVVDPKDLLKE